MYMVSLGRRITKLEWWKSCSLEVSVTVPFVNRILLQGKDLLSRVRSLTTATHHKQYSNIFTDVEHFLLYFKFSASNCVELCVVTGIPCTLHVQLNVYFLLYFFTISDFLFFM